MGIINSRGRDENSAAITRGKAGGILSDADRSALEGLATQAGSRGRDAKEALQKGK